MKLANFILAAGCLFAGVALVSSGFTWQAGLFWYMGVLYIKCGLDTTEEE